MYIELVIWSADRIFDIEIVIDRRSNARSAGNNSICIFDLDIVIDHKIDYSFCRYSICSLDI